MKISMSRRDLFKFGGVAAIGAAGAASLAGCAPKQASEDEKETKAASWRDAPEPIADIAETVDYDLVVVGAGNAGLMGAMTAQQQGFKVVIIEKGQQVASAREAVGAIGSRHAGEHTPDIPMLMNHVRKTQTGDVNMALWRTWCDKSGEFMDWLEDTETPAGMTFPFEWHAPDDPEAYYPAMCTNPVMGDFNPQGPNYGAYQHLEVMRDLFLEAGGTIDFLTTGEQLVQNESGKVTGVLARFNKDQYRQYNAAKGVIVCTGGYGANREMVEDLCPDALKYCTSTAATTESGDGIRMALWAGAYLEEGAGAVVWNRGITDDTEQIGPDMGMPLFLPASQPFLRVNVHGERFMNEDSTYPEIYAQGTRQPKGFSWQVFDGTYWEDIQRFDTGGCSRLAPAPDGSAFNADVYDLEAMSKDHLDSFWIQPRLDDGTLKKCDTLEELAKTMFSDEADQKAFLATVERYNEVMASGDVDYGKAAYRCSTVDTAPFYAIRTTGNFLVTINGIVTDTDSRALRQDGTVIEGLYVCGNDQGGFYPHGYPSEFTGVNAGRCGCFARIAAKHACGIA